MVNALFFFTYIIAGFVGFLAILLAVLLIRHWSSGNKQLLAAIRNFMICTALIDALYFYFNYAYLKADVYTAAPLHRVLDIFTFIGQVYFWSAYIREKCRFPQAQRKPMFLVSLCLCGFCFVTALASYGFFMDDYYFVPPGPLRDLSVLIEILLSICLTFITVWHLMKGLSELVQKKIRTLVTIISVLISVNGTWNAVLSFLLMTGALNPPGDLAVDPTGLFLLLINLFTVLLIYQEDFFALFRIEEIDENEEIGEGETGAGEAAGGKAGNAAALGALEAETEMADGSNGSKKGSELPPALPEKAAKSAPEDRPKTSPENRIKNRLDFIAQSHSLTQREREVLELAYEGMTNPEIAEVLTISKYTVKRHMHNIFEKLDISTRMELVHLINSENGPGGPL